MAGALEGGAPLEADRLSAEAELGDAYFLPAAAEAAQAHELAEHTVALQRRTVTAAGNSGVFERRAEKDLYLKLQFAREQRDKTLRQVA